MGAGAGSQLHVTGGDWQGRACSPHMETQEHSCMAAQTWDTRFCTWACPGTQTPPLQSWACTCMGTCLDSHAQTHPPHHGHTCTWLRMYGLTYKGLLHTQTYVHGLACTDLPPMDTHTFGYMYIDSHTQIPCTHRHAYMDSQTHVHTAIRAWAHIHRPISSMDTRMHDCTFMDSHMQTPTHKETDTHAQLRRHGFTCMH